MHLSGLGHDVVFMRDLNKGAPDSTVLILAVEQDRILVTADKDFGERVFLDRLDHRGIILLRPPDERLNSKLEILDRLLAERAEDLSTSFVVASNRNIRIRPRRP